MFIHVHWHSHYSLLEAIGKPKDIIAIAEEYSMPAIAITDYSGMYGAIEFYKNAKKSNVKPLIWVDLGLVEDRTVKDRDESCGNIVLLAKSYDGYQHLLKLVSHANLEWYHWKARVDFGLLREFNTDIICLQSWHASYLGHLIMNDASHKQCEDFVGLLDSIYGNENVYLWITAQEYDKVSAPLEKIDTAIIDIASSCQKDLFIDVNFHYPKRHNKKAFEIALSIKDGKRVFDEWRRLPDGELHIMNEEEIIKTCKKNGYPEEDVTNYMKTNQVISDACNLEIPLWTILFPKYESPEEIKKLYEANKDSLISK